MNIFKTVAKKIGSILLNFAYNEDRSIASLGGAPKDFTISAESAKQPFLKPLGAALDDVHFAGDPNHAQDALIHDTALQAADNQLKAEGK
ncbi:MAG TPA: hypothetical protein VNV63_04965 [Nitrospiria bacterium]|jgi:hypothetical protein|nr:hypothetical protein [Nitrospiria bacterium]